MTEFECRQALEQKTVGRLACSRDNQPYVVPVYFVFHRDQHLLFHHTWAKGRVDAHQSEGVPRDR